MDTILMASIIVSVIALLFAWILISQIKRKPDGNEKVKEIAGHIHKGAMTFLKKEYRIMVIFMLVIMAVIYFALGKEHQGPQMAITFFCGSIFSALAGWIGMNVATKANSRTAIGASKSLNEGLKTAFSSGVVMGMNLIRQCRLASQSVKQDNA